MNKIENDEKKNINNEEFRENFGYQNLSFQQTIYINQINPKMSKQ